jgi:hypothetical protein
MANGLFNFGGGLLGGNYSSALESLRAQYGPELNDPNFRRRLFGLVRAEVGGQGSAAEKSFLESLLNRSIARGTPVAGQMTTGQSGYYPSLGTPTEPTPAQLKTLDEVMRGSDITGRATGNASQRVGFGGGVLDFLRFPFQNREGLPQVTQVGGPGGERFRTEMADVPFMASLPAENVTGSPAGLPTQAAEDETIPTAAAYASGTLPKGEGKAPQSFAGRISSTLGDLAPTLLALGGGTLQGGLGRGASEAAKIAVASDKALLDNDIRSYQFARKQGYPGTFQQWLNEPFRANQALQPTYVQNPDGTISAVQLSQRGPPVPVQLGPGQTVLPPTYSVPGPTGTNILTRPGGLPAGGATPPAAGNVPPGAATAPAAGSTLGTPPQSSSFIPKDLQTPARITIDEAAVKDAATNLTRSRAVLPLLDQVVSLANKTPGGWAGPVSASVSRALSGMGFPVSEGMSNAELMTSITQQLVPTVRQPGQVSNYEQQVYSAAVPGIMQSPEARVKIAEMVKAQVERQAEIVATYRKYVGSPELDNKLAEIDKKPIFNESQRELLTQYAAPIPVSDPSEARNYPPGTRLLLPDGNIGRVPRKGTPSAPARPPGAIIRDLSPPGLQM